MGWKWLIFDRDPDGGLYKAHGCPDYLVTDVVNEAHARGHRVKTAKNLTEWSFDPGGMCIANEPTIDIVIDGLSIGLWCVDVDSFASRCKRMIGEPRRYGDVIACKVHGAYHCCVFTPGQLTLLVHRLEEEAPAARAAYEKFHAEWKQRLADDEKSPWLRRVSCSS